MYTINQVIAFGICLKNNTTKKLEIQPIICSPNILIFFAQKTFQTSQPYIRRQIPVRVTLLTKHTVGCAEKMSKRVLVISISNPLQISTNLALPIPLETVPLIQKPLLPYEFSLTFG